MRKDYLYSVAAHLFILVFIGFYSDIFKDVEFRYYRQIYEVDLVELPKAEPEAQPEKPSDGAVAAAVEKKDEAPKKTAKRPLRKKPTQVEAEPDTVKSEEPEEKKQFTAAGGAIKLDVETFEHLWYLSLIQNKIQNNWKPPILANAGGSISVIYFKIMRNGSIVDIKMEKQSNFFLLDQSALRAVSESRKFPPLPKGFEKSFLGVHFEFEYIQ